MIALAFVACGIGGVVLTARLFRFASDPHENRDLAHHFADTDEASAPEGSWLLWNAHTYSDEA